eukprot:1846388-Rhodomonas_salina.1
MCIRDRREGARERRGAKGRGGRKDGRKEVRVFSGGFAWRRRGVCVDAKGRFGLMLKGGSV